MSLRTQTIEPRHFQQLVSTPEFENLVLSARESISIATQALNHHAFQVVTTSTDQQQRSYFSWELLTIAVETIELLGSILVQQHDPDHASFHQAANAELKEIFTRYEAPLALGTIQDFLRLPPPTDHRDGIVRSSFVAILHAGGRAINTLASFWLQYIDAVRWFRHYPAHLTINDVEVIDPGPNPSKSAALHRLATTEDLIDVVVVPEDQGFGYLPLTLRDVHSAASATRLAIQVVLTRTSNQYLAPEAKRDDERLPKLYPFLLEYVSLENRERLAKAGPYYLAR